MQVPPCAYQLEVVADQPGQALEKQLLLAGFPPIESHTLSILTHPHQAVPGRNKNNGHLPQPHQAKQVSLKAKSQHENY